MTDQVVGEATTVDSLWSRESIQHVSVLIIALAAVVLTLGLANVDWNVPFAYRGDALATLADVKGVMENGTVYTNPSLAAPDGAQVADFPNFDGLNWLLIRAIGAATKDPARTMNVFYVLGFPLAALAASFLFRQAGVWPPASVVGSVLFALLPYHLIRSEGHLMLASYFAVPLGLVLCLWVTQEEPPFFGRENPFGSGALTALRRLLPSALLCLAIGSAGLYYAFFTCILVVGSGVLSIVRRRNFKGMAAALVMVAAIGLIIFVQAIPTLSFQREHGPNPTSARREAYEADIYGLRITQLVLPQSSHRARIAAESRETYNRTIASVEPNAINENDSASLGLFAATGFIFLLLWLAFRPRLRRSHPSVFTLDQLATLNLTALLFGTVGGLGGLFAFLVSPQIRAYNRISIFLGCIALLAWGVAATILRSSIRKRRSVQVLAAVCVVVLTLGLWDQTSPAYVPPYQSLKTSYEADEAFVQSVGQRLDADAMVFQLPYVPYPEYPPVERMLDYDHLMPYIHSTDLRWSYGAVKGRPTDRWQRNVAALPAVDMLKQLHLHGFAAIWIDTYGYPDEGAQVVNAISGSLQGERLESPNGRYVVLLME
ncbi:MAG: hypothetical protein Q8K99_05270 [Actinomycetota bacterium]|nr:hypothetical protein [Actinomycetota bacterium]